MRIVQWLNVTLHDADKKWRIALQLVEHERLWDMGMRVVIFSFQWARI